MIYAKGKEVVDIYAGGKPVQKVYAGGELVWQRADTITYTYHFSLSYSQSSLIFASGSNHAILEVERKTYINGTLDKTEYYDATISFPSNPDSTFSSTPISTGKYKITAPSRGTTEGAQISGTVKATVGTWSQTETIKQQANEKTVYDTKTEVDFSISSAYTYGAPKAPASGASWTATASAEEQDYIKYQYTSGAVDASWAKYGVSKLISPSDISMYAYPYNGDLTGSGTGSVTLLTFANMEREEFPTGRSAYVYAEYNGSEDYVYVYQAKNELLDDYNYTITSLKLNDTDGNITIAPSAQNVLVVAAGTCTENWDSGTYTNLPYNVPHNNLSVIGVGFSYSAGVVSVSEHYGTSTRNATVQASYKGQSLSRIITQMGVSVIVTPPVLSIASAQMAQGGVLLSCTIESAGGGIITALGFEWGTTSAYGQSQSLTPLQLGQFQHTITLYQVGRTLYFRAYATNEEGTTYSVNTFLPPLQH